MERERVLDLLELAIQLAGDGGPCPFDDDEYEAMGALIEELRNNLN